MSFWRDLGKKVRTMHPSDIRRFIRERNEVRREAKEAYREVKEAYREAKEAEKNDKNDKDGTGSADDSDDGTAGSSGAANASAKAAGGVGRRLPIPRALAGRSNPKKKKYTYIEPEPAVLLNQKAIWERLSKGEPPAEALGTAFSVLRTNHVPKFSVIVTTYEPVIRYFEQTVISILSQTFGGYELIIADTSMSTAVHDALERYRDKRIRYYSVPGNRGDASLINDAAYLASGDYICTVDCGDLLTPDALYEVFLAIMRTKAEILYTDEDMCDSLGRRFEQPYRKPDFNKDYLLSTNYTKHLLVIRRELFLALKMRDAYDGALSYDLMLRAPKSEVCHVPHILYHVSSASSEAKKASREPDADISAGKAALEDYLRVRDIHATVHYSSRRGIYRIDYVPSIFACRSDVGVVGGRVLSRTHKVIGGMIDAKGQTAYEGWDEAEGGPRNQALTMQDAFAVDVRCMQVRAELRSLYGDIFGFSYNDSRARSMEDPRQLRQDSIIFCRTVREMGYLIVWDPGYITVV